MSLFQASVLKKYSSQLDKPTVQKAYKKYSKYFHNSAIQENIRNSKEEQFQEGFLRELFVDILGYTLNPSPKFNLTTELKNLKGAKKVDGAILKDDKALAVIELKGTNTKDLESIRQQAFDYKANQIGCIYVITSNFEKLRFYINNAVDFEEFNLFTLTETEFELFYLCLAKDNLLANKPLTIKEASIVEEENITKKFYGDYSIFKRELYRDLVKQNMKNETFRELNEKNVKLTLFKKSQKLIDRFLFILFAEDRGLLAPNSITTILNEWKALEELDMVVPLYDRYKQYFSYLDTGRKGTDKKEEIFAYNGGLFQPDALLDAMIIDDDLLYRHTKKLTTYDFQSQVDVNILGHIFEHSLNEIESVNAEIEGTDFDKQKTKRKKDGVFYTPKYITKYIVDNTIGKLCTDKKQELGIIDEEYAKGRKNRQATTIVKLDQQLKEYRDWLLQLTICDPACGSGAFLNQALDFLIREHSYVDELNRQLFGGGFAFPDIENQILEHNIYGVDLNEESVEIAKLSLWLRTAQPKRKLTSLNNNIKCGNSLIESKAVAGDKAFNWKEQFPEVFEKGGFDVIIGNPPYVPTEYITEIDKTYLEKNYQSAFGRMNLYPIFYEKGISTLREKGILGFITPYTILKNQYYKEARKYIIDNTKIIELIDFKGILVFQDAAVDSIILLLQKEVNDKYQFKQISNIVSFENQIYSLDNFDISEIKQNEDLSMLVTNNDKLIKRLSKNTKPLKEILNFNQGIITGGNSKYITNKKSELTEKVITGSDFNRYLLNNSNQYIIYDVKELHRPRKREIFEATEKILLRQTASYPICTIDYEQFFTLDTVHNGLLIDQDYSLKYLLVLMNSRLLRFFYESQINEGGKVFAQVKIIYIDPLPIQILTKTKQKPFEEIADKMFLLKNNLQELSQKFQRTIQRKFNLEDLPKKLQDWYVLTYAEFIKELAKKKVKLSLSEEAEWEDYFETESKKAQDLKAQIDKTDKKIDQMVYELYGLSEEEIGIVENS
ncbi:Eco57I restriction-modification methylase domain-containing protein [Flavobacterium sp.]|jgi:type I restriction-modification system DNA methylase subunit|uniref:Eco57I restriction-modification methylase domain-containing protein n=1 Tax=Flavobacterium sp. TaxID=239 RepID=UPI0037C0DE57